MYKYIVTAVSLGFLLVPSVFAQDDTQILDKEKAPAAQLNFQSFSSCDAMDDVLSDYFRDALVSQLKMYGGSTGGMPMPVLIEDDMDSGMKSSNSISPALSVDARDGIGGGGMAYSLTNVQVEGIDEAEVIKTDGKYIYYASNQIDTDGYQYVTITRAVPAKDLSVVKRIKLPNNYGNIQLYLGDKKLTIIANKWNQNYFYAQTPISIGNGSATIVAVYDIADVSAPRLERFYSVNGDLSQSRRGGDYLYVLSQNYVSLNVWGPTGAYTEDEISKFIDTKFDPSTVLPQTIEIGATTNTAQQATVKGKKIPYSLSQGRVKCNEVEYILPEKPENLSFLTLSVISLKDSAQPIQRKVIYGDAAQFFMSENSFYIVSNYWKQGGNFSCPINARCLMPNFRSEQNSLIHRFSANDGVVKYEYSVLTPGIPLSQYALHERDGVLFTANQKDWTTNGVDVFAIDSTGKLLSTLENVGAKERFQSARYIGDRLYLVTFEQVDPFFVINTKDPKKMSILGELKMPGYSTYLHPYDENHLIGIGYDTKTASWGGTVNGGLKFDLYDVTDVTKPRQQFSKVIGGMGSNSDALWNPRALVWDSARKTLLIPAQLMDQSPTTYQSTYAWQGLLAISIDASKGISEAARITHIDMSGIAEKRKAECAAYVNTVTEEKCYTHIVTGEKICVKPSENPANTSIPSYCYAEMDDSSYLANQIWNYYASFVQRGLYIGDTIYTASPDTIQANNYGGSYGEIKSVKNQ